MSPEQIKEKIKSKQAYTLNLSDNMTDRIVHNAQASINQLAEKREALFQLYEERRAAYENAQREFQETRQAIDALDEEMRQQTLIVDALQNFRAKADPDKRIQLHDDAEMPAVADKTKRPRLISWQDEATDVLNTAARFMPAHEIFDLIIQKPHVQEALKQMKTAKAMSTVKATTVNNFITHAMKVSKGEWNARFAPTLTLYKELIGLVEWVDKDGAVVPPYNQQFIPKKLQRENISTAS